MSLFNLLGIAPWFDAYRDYFFQYLPLSDHEYIRNFMACILYIFQHKLQICVYHMTPSIPSQV